MFNVIIALNVFASLSALIVLKPMMRARMRSEIAGQAVVPTPAAHERNTARRFPEVVPRLHSQEGS